jgi:hypothetical protein
MSSRFIVTYVVTPLSEVFPAVQQVCDLGLVLQELAAQKGFTNHSYG